jgi:hypothetical protein
MTRSKSLTVAAILQFLLSIVDFAMAIPILAAGSAGLPPPSGAEGASGPPFFIGVVFLTLAVASLFGAYGLWSNHKWGKVITLITRGISGLFALGDVLATTMGGRPDIALGFAAYVVASIVVIVLVLRREQTPVLA